MAVCRGGLRVPWAQQLPTVGRVKEVADEYYGRRLPATATCGPKPGDFPIGSLESRAAARAMLGILGPSECICFPADEPPHLELKVEVEAARAVQ